MAYQTTTGKLKKGRRVMKAKSKTAASKNTGMFGRGMKKMAGKSPVKRAKAGSKKRKVSR